MSSATFRCLTIKTGDGAPRMNGDGRYRYVFNVSIHSDATGVTRRFTYNDSIHNYSIGQRGLAGDDLLEAFRCFVGDAQAGLCSHAEFCDDFGYDVDSIAAKRMWTDCKAATVKYRALWSASHGIGGHTWTNDSVSDHISGVLAELARMGVE